MADTTMRPTLHVPLSIERRGESRLGYIVDRPSYTTTYWRGAILFGLLTPRCHDEDDVFRISDDVKAARSGIAWQESERSEEREVQDGEVVRTREAIPKTRVGPPMSQHSRVEEDSQCTD